MSSFLNTTSTVTTTTRLPADITKADVLSVLRDDNTMLKLNPLNKSSTKLPPSSSTAFYKSVPKDLKPASADAIENIPVYCVVEASGPEGEESGNSWRGGWAKRFIPDEITYETSFQAHDYGMFQITHAPMGVQSSTKWIIREAKESDPVVEAVGKTGLVLEQNGEVTSNRMLMGFIKTTLQSSYDQLAKDFIAMVEKEMAKKRGDVETSEAEKAATVDKHTDQAGAGVVG
ncbi:hypothetical protein LSUE1_G007325 [Lachnellula suecica]|uniref:DUF7053 domain-containing protein n=1 Tax=Lachnellula suecica TaxID=602035 RepID=A0A8T9C101_9HELO|nr:hypothetical protein LSUE1_G007325 [Lachnellula suecica]